MKQKGWKAPSVAQVLLANQGVDWDEAAGVKGLNLISHLKGFAFISHYTEGF